MRTLTVGLQLFHNGRPVQLLYRKRAGPLQELWRVRPLFVDYPRDSDEVFVFTDRLSLVHGTSAQLGPLRAHT